MTVYWTDEKRPAGNPCQRTFTILYFLNSLNRRYDDKRIPQSTRVTVTIVKAITTATRSSGRAQNHFPNTPENNDQGPTTNATIASKAPPELARNDLNTCPRTMCAHDVVIPQEGQRESNHISNEQGGNPSC